VSTALSTDELNRRLHSSSSSSSSDSKSSTGNNKDQSMWKYGDALTAQQQQQQQQQADVLVEKCDIAIGPQERVTVLLRAYPLVKGAFYLYCLYICI
jgi:hypothetical protein